MKSKKNKPIKQRQGRKPWIPTAQEIKEIEQMSSIGLTQEQIAWNLGINPDTLHTRKHSHPEISEAIKKGRAKGTRHVVSALMQNIESGNFNAQKFWLTVHAGWIDTTRNEHIGDKEKPIEHNINVVNSIEFWQERLEELLG